MPKTSFTVRSKQWDLFNRECKATSLRRDDLLDRVLAEEIELLAKVPPCDTVGSKWLKANWVMVGPAGDKETVSVALSLSAERLKRLNEVCDHNGVPRDAFLDCALEFLTRRLLEAAIVIKNPRSGRDLVAQIAAAAQQVEDDGLSQAEWKQFALEAVNEWVETHDFSSFRDDFYSSRLHHTEAQIEKANQMLRELDLLGGDL